MTRQFLGLICGVSLSLLFAGSRSEAGSLYVSDTAADTIYVYDSSGQRSVFATTPTGSQPRGLASDADGNLYVAYFGDSIVQKFSPSGENLGLFVSQGLLQPETLVFDSAGNLYVTSIGNGTVHKFSPSGNDLGAIVTGLSRAVGLAIDGSNVLYVAASGVIENYSTS